MKHALILAPVLLFSIMTAVTQTRPILSPQDQAALQLNQLTMNTVTRFYQASGDLQKLTMRDQDARNALGQEILSIGSLASRIQNSSALSGVVRQHGFTPQSFALTELSVLQATFALGDRMTGASDKTLTNAHVNVTNVDLFQKHAQEIAAIRTKYVH